MGAGAARGEDGSAGGTAAGPHAGAEGTSGAAPGGAEGSSGAAPGGGEGSSGAALGGAEGTSGAAPGGADGSSDATPADDEGGGGGGISLRVWLTAGAIGGLLVAAVAVGLGSRSGPMQPPSRADAVPYDGRSPRAPATAEQRVLVALPRPALGDLPAARRRGAEVQRRYVRSLIREQRSLRSALAARGIRLRAVVAFTRTWNGFAATVPAAQVARLSSLGEQARPVRRLFPALGDPVPIVAAGEPPALPPAGQAPVAVLASGVDRGAPLLEGRLGAGYDAIGRDRDASPGEREQSGTALAGVLAAAGERVLPIRVAAGAAEHATTDTVLAGLEHAVDPDGDLATDDHVAVALVGVNAPFAAFPAAPEAAAAAAAAALGTLVVAPAGNEGRARGPAPTVGTPGSGPGALTVGALAAPAAVASTALEVGDVQAAGAVALGGSPAAVAGRTAGPVASTDPRRLQAVRGRVAVVRAGADPSARAAAAAAAGARAVLVADPGRGPLPAMPAGRVGVPVLGVTGAAARAVLAAPSGATVRVARRRAGRIAEPRPAVSPFSSRGTVKPDLAAPGAAATIVVGGAAAVAGGSAVAAAQAAAAAARAHRERPALEPAALAAALTAAADPAGLPVAATGAGVLRAAPRGGGLRVEREVGGAGGGTSGGAGTASGAGTAGGGGTASGAGTARAGGAVRLRIRNDGPRRVRAALAATQDGAAAPAVTPGVLDLAPGRAATITITPAAAGAAPGRLVARSGAAVVLSAAWAPATAVAPVPVGPLELVSSDGRVTGVRFTVGAFDRGDPRRNGARLAVAERLELALTRGERAVRTLTPPGGARELLPGEYAYTLPATTLQALSRGTYAFRARAHAPGQTAPTEQRSAPFER